MLLDFVIFAKQELVALSGDNKAARFIQLRYFTMSDVFPHKTFSVQQATLDFFDIAYRHLMGLEALPKNEGQERSEYIQNYINWIKANK